MKAQDLLPYMNRRRAADMQALGRELEVSALEIEIRGLDVEIDVADDRLTKDALEAQRAELQIQLDSLKEEA